MSGATQQPPEAAPSLLNSLSSRIRALCADYSASNAQGGSQQRAQLIVELIRVHAKTPEGGELRNTNTRGLIRRARMPVPSAVGQRGATADQDQDQGLAAKLDELEADILDIQQRFEQGLQQLEEQKLQEESAAEAAVEGEFFDEEECEEEFFNVEMEEDYVKLGDSSGSESEQSYTGRCLRCHMRLDEGAAQHSLDRCLQICMSESLSLRLRSEQLLQCSGLERVEEQQRGSGSTDVIDHMTSQMELDPLLMLMPWDTLIL